MAKRRYKKTGQEIIEIEDGYPVPTERVQHTNWRWKNMIDDMELGDSFKVEDCTHSMHCSVNQAFARSGFRCRSERNEEDGSRRFWRIEDE